MTERKLQTDIIQWLKQRGAYVIKTRPGPGVPVGCPDIIGLYGHRWLAIEVKSSKAAKFQPGQLSTLRRLAGQNGYVYIVNPDNWYDTQQDLIATWF